MHHEPTAVTASPSRTSSPRAKRAGRAGGPRAWAAALLASTALAGCGTIAGRTEVVSLDSVPRGQAVFEKVGDEERKLGVTPLFVKVKRGASHTWRFGEDGERYVTQECHWRWDEAVIPDALLTGIGIASAPFLVFGGAAFAVDGFTGAIHTCPSGYRYTFQTREAKGKPCRTILLAPPEHPDEKVSDEIAQAWIAGAKAKLAACDRILFDDDVKGAFLAYGLDHAKYVSIRSLPRRKWQALGQRFGATDVATLDVNLRRQGEELLGKVVDLHRQKESDAEAIAVAVTSPEALARIKEHSWLISSINVFPNSLFLSMLGAKTGPTPRQFPDLAVTRTRERETLPSYLTALGLGHADNPRAFRPWDWDFKVSPSLYFDYKRLRVHYEAREGATPPESAEPATTFDYDVSYLYALPSVNAGPTFHTPMGAFSASLGLGLVGAFLDDSLGNRIRRGGLAVGIRLAHDAFLGESLFVRTEIQGWGMSADLVNTPYLEGKGGLASFSINLGYLFPGTRRVVRGLF